MRLSDIDYVQAANKAELGVSPIDATMLQGASIDLHLGNDFRFFINKREPIDTHKTLTEDDFVRYNLADGQAILIPAKTFFLGESKESIFVDEQHSADLRAKSTLSRYGLILLDGYIDPYFGFVGTLPNVPVNIPYGGATDKPGRTLTLEIFNSNDRDIILYVGDAIFQVTFDRMITPARHKYTSFNGHHYAGQSGATIPVPLKEIVPETVEIAHE